MRIAFVAGGLMVALALSGCASHPGGSCPAPAREIAAQPAPSVPEPAAPGISPGEWAEEWPRYESAEWGYRISHPEAWRAVVAFENPGSPEGVIKQEIIFRGPDGATITLDVWANEGGRDLLSWANEHRQFPLNEEKDFSETDVIETAGLPSVKTSRPPTGQTYGESGYVIAAGDLILRLRYADSDGGKSAGIFERMAASVGIR